MHKKIAKNTLFQTVAKIFSSGTGFLITVLIARYFGVVGYGDFIKITSFVALFYLIVDFGINAIFLREDDKLSHFKDIFYLRLLISLGIFIVTNLISLLLPFNSVLGIGFSSPIKLGIFVFSFTLFFQSIIYSTSAVFQKELKYSLYSYSVIFGSILNLILVGGVILLKGTILEVVLSYLIGAAATAFLGIILAKKSILPFSLDLTFSKKIILSSLPLGIMLIFNLVYFRVDTILLSLLKPSTDVGVYGLSYKFFDFLIALPLFLSNSLYPFLLENKKNTRKFFVLVWNYLLIFAIIGVFLIIPFLFLSPLFAFIKKDFMLSILPFNFLLFSLPIFFVTSLLQWTLITLGRQKFLMWVYFVSTVFNIILNLIFIPQYSYLASAIITGVTELLVMIILGIALYNLKIILERDVQIDGN
jgi:O-antigen/teichoic acid export membrane protein